MRIGIALLVLLVAADAGACAADFGEIAYLDSVASHVFAGTVVEARTVETLQDILSSYLVATIAVREVWKGDVPDTVTVVTGRHSCGAPLRTGTEIVCLPDKPDRRRIEVLAAADLGCVPGSDADCFVVWINNAARYEKAGDAVHIVLGSPTRVAGGLTARSVTLEEILDALERARGGKRDEYLYTLQRSRSRLAALAESRDPGERALFAETLELVLGLALDRSRGEVRFRPSALTALHAMGPHAKPALPDLLEMEALVATDQFDRSFWYTVLDIDDDHPGVQARLIELTGNEYPEETRLAAFDRLWRIRPVVDGAPRPTAFVADRSPRMRQAALSHLAWSTTSADSMDLIADLVLNDPDPDVMVSVYQYVPEGFLGEQAVRRARIALAHDDPRIREYAYRHWSIRRRPAAVRCAILRAAFASDCEEVRERAARFWFELGGDCDPDR